MEVLRSVLVPGWRTVAESRTGTSVTLTLLRDGTTVDVTLERCASGRLRDSYPVGARDVEIRVGECAQRGPLLRELADAVLDADPRCRRVVHAVPPGDGETLTAAESAGFRLAVEVDLGQDELALLVAEPEWVTGADLDLDRVPGA